MPSRLILGVVAICMAGIACADPPTPSDSGPDQVNPPLPKQVLALKPGPHTYRQIAVLLQDHQGKLSRPAYIRISPGQPIQPSHIVISSGNAAFDQAALAAASADVPLLSAADPDVAQMICADAGKRCPAASPWAQSQSLRSPSSIQKGFDLHKGRIVKVFKEALKAGKVEGSGKVTLKITIAPSGTATECVVADSTFSDQGFAQDLAATVCSINFDPEDVIDTTVYPYPIEFHPL